MWSFKPLISSLVFIAMQVGLGEVTSLHAAGSWRAGFSRLDITPTQPVRMTGYGNRDRPSEGVDTPLYARCMALQYASEPVHLLFTVDNIGLSGEQTRLIAKALESSHGISRERVVFSSTHTHCGPDLVLGLDNIFTTELSETEITARQHYSESLASGLLKAGDNAIKNLTAATIAYGHGEVGFAANRRVLNEGRWMNFGVQADGPVDHSVGVLRVSSPDGKLLGAIFNYACHCTTLGGDHYRINADWAGYAATQLEKSNPGCTALCTIGCGADANPEPRGTLEMAQTHGLTLAAEVERVIQQPMTELTQSLTSNYDYAGLAFDLPTNQELDDRTRDKSPQTRRNAEHLQAIYQEHGRLPATYPVPIQGWRFGDELTMVFLGGEVVVDYAMRLKKELNQPNLWVSAYCNDVLGYICSERMRREGGYEFDRSGVYYNLPGPWASGTEDLLVRRIREMLESPSENSPLSPDAGLRSMQVPDRFKIQLVASEPLVSDPINIAFAPDGRLWVVEMGDYPGSEASKSDTPIASGRVKVLNDTDKDGVFDTATTFMEGLSFPTGVHPWNDGVIISAAPDIIFARDTNGDDKADETETWYSGFPLANPQHRINGFTYGLEHALHCASGDNLSEITAVRTNKTVNASGRDFRIWPTSGELDLLSGRTQYIRSRNDWAESFGNDNSRPMYHYPIEDRYLLRNSAVRYSGNQRYLFDPPSAPPVYPRSNTSDRYNDLFAANRFTSACSAIVFRSSELGEDLAGNAFICEPVHNLVHRAILTRDGASYQATRHSSETQSEFLASTDPWFRPTRVTEGTDGMLWVVDMYRAVIEHPEWIPMAWQEQVNLRAGEGMGRIYRIVPSAQTKNTALPVLTGLGPIQLAEYLESPHGALRDLAQQQLLCHHQASDAVERLLIIASQSKSPQARVHALWCLESLGKLSVATLEVALTDTHFGVVRTALLLSESYLAEQPSLLKPMAELTGHADARVQLQLALTAGQSSDEVAGKILVDLVEPAIDDNWLARAVMTSASMHSAAILKKSLSLLTQEKKPSESAHLIELISNLLRTAANSGDSSVQDQVTTALRDAPVDAAWATQLATAWMDAYPKDKSASSSISPVLKEIYTRDLAIATSDTADEPSRCRALSLFGRGIADEAKEIAFLVNLISPRVPLAVQLTALDRLSSIGHVSAADELIRKWATLSVSVRSATVASMLRTPSWTTAFLGAIADKSVSPSELSVAARQQLQMTGNQSTRALAQRLLKDNAANDRSELVTRYLAVTTDIRDSIEPNIAQGGETFKRLCAACHTADTQGRISGPNLANLTDFSSRALTEAILDPNRRVDPQYLSYSVLLENGQTLVGAIAEEAGDSLTLVQADAKRLTIARVDIEEIRNTSQSLMPQGFETELTLESMRDLIAFVRWTSKTSD